MISVAVCDEPAGKYEFYGYVKYSDGIAIGKKNEPFQFDPGVFMDDDGKLYLYPVLHWQETRSFWMVRNRRNMARCVLNLILLTC